MRPTNASAKRALRLPTKCDREKMSIYTQLLGAALAERSSATEGLSAPEVLAELLRSRRGLNTSGESHGGPYLALDAVANQLSYDVALIRLAWALGIDCEINDFDRPDDGRVQTELSLTSRGIQIAGLDLQTPVATTRGEDMPSGS
jgi:hypothetical protein